MTKKVLLSISVQLNHKRHYYSCLDYQKVIAITNITTQTIITIIMISHNATFTITTTKHDTITISLITEIKL